ncbi:hypothetical protein [Nostoc sp. DedQUE09]|uniref:hypothetical protein n=1 Tax=Nostoc sp. DedQUE09 TaxID=3075394 RepID=UPI002AD4E5E2|nr:hypothetical protein [Nostoc sp. DedQUE09]
MSLVATPHKLGISFMSILGERIYESRIIFLSLLKEAAIAASFSNFKKYLCKR